MRNIMLVILGILVAVVISGHAQNSKENANSLLLQLSGQRGERHVRSPRHQYSYVAHRPYLPLATGYGYYGHHANPWHRHGYGHGHGGGHGHRHGHGSKGFYKNYKSGFHKGHGHKGKKGFRDKEGLKKKAHGNHGKWKHKGYHDKDGKKYKGHKHKKKYYGDVHKGFKGNKGHHFGTKGHHNKGHKDKGFKNVYHKEEYHHKKKFYDDYDNKKYHNKYDDIDKYVKGHKGSDFKGGHYKGGHHNDKYGSTDEKEEGEYHDNDYKVKDHYKHKKYYNDNHKHGHKKGFKGGFKEGHSETQGHGHHHKEGHDDHDGHHSHTHEHLEEAPSQHNHSGHEDEDHHQVSDSKNNPVKVHSETNERDFEEKEEAGRVDHSPRSPPHTPPPPSPPPILSPRPGYRASPEYMKYSRSTEGHHPDSQSSKKDYKLDYSSVTDKKKTPSSRPAPSYVASKAKTKKIQKSVKGPSPTLQGGALRIVPPPTFKLPSGPTTSLPSRPSTSFKYKNSHSQSDSNKYRYKPPTTSGTSYTYGKKLSPPSVEPSLVRPNPPSHSEFSHSQSSPAYVPFSAISSPKSAKAPATRSHQPWIKNFSNSLAAKEVLTPPNFRRPYNPISKPGNKEQTTLPILNGDQPSVVSAKKGPEDKLLSTVRQSLKYRSRPTAFTLPNPSATSRRPSSKYAKNHLSTNTGGGSSSGFRNSFSHKKFEDFGNFGEPLAISFQHG